MLPILVNNNDTLTSLVLNKCNLEPDQIKCIAKFLKKNKTLSILDLSGNKMNDVAAAKSLALAMKKHPGLFFLNLSNCTLGANSSIVTNRWGHSYTTYNNGENDEVLSALLGGCKKITTLLLEYNHIKAEGSVAIVAKFLKNNKSLTVFSIDNNEMGELTLKLCVRP